MKRFNFDPYDMNYGGLVYAKLRSRKAIESLRYGQLWIEGCMLYAIGRNNIDDGAQEVSDNGEIGDLLIWPPTRQLARVQGKL